MLVRKGPLQHQILLAAMGMRCEARTRRIAHKAGRPRLLAADAVERPTFDVRRSTPGSGEAIHGKARVSTTTLWLKSALIRVWLYTVPAPSDGGGRDLASGIGLDQFVQEGAPVHHRLDADALVQNG